jgi:hypothetical protein
MWRVFQQRACLVTAERTRVGAHWKTTHRRRSPGDCEGATREYASSGSGLVEREPRSSCSLMCRERATSGDAARRIEPIHGIGRSRACAVKRA